MQEEARAITKQSVIGFNQSVANGKITPFVEFGSERKTRLYHRDDLEAYLKNKKRANARLHMKVLIVDGKKKLNAVVFDQLAFERIFKSYAAVVEINSDTVLFKPEFENGNVQIFARYDNAVIRDIPVIEYAKETDLKYPTMTYDLEMYVNDIQIDSYKYYEKLVPECNKAAKSNNVYLKAISSENEGYVTQQGLFFEEKTEWKFKV